MAGRGNAGQIWCGRSNTVGRKTNCYDHHWSWPTAGLARPEWHVTQGGQSERPWCCRCPVEQDGAQTRRSVVHSRFSLHQPTPPRVFWLCLGSWEWWRSGEMEAEGLRIPGQPGNGELSSKKLKQQQKITPGWRPHLLPPFWSLPLSPFPALEPLLCLVVCYSSSCPALSCCGLNPDPLTLSDSFLPET